MKIAILIPSTSNGRTWTSIRETYLFAYTLKTFFLTYDKEHTYKFYIGIDRGDPIYDTETVKTYLARFCSVMENTSIEFYYMDNIAKGHLTVMWNKLFDIAYAENNDYFFQCGDDIEFQTAGWVNACISKLTESSGIGLTGPLNNNSRILTQSFVSRKHMELFGHFFPPEIINWCCDDWINEVYRGLHNYYPILDHKCINIGGAPRYTIANDLNVHHNISTKLHRLRADCTKIVERDLRHLYERTKPIGGK